jgi:hypothetical protein
MSAWLSAFGAKQTSDETVAWFGQTRFDSDIRRLRIYSLLGMPGPASSVPARRTTMVCPQPRVWV